MTNSRAQLRSVVREDRAFVGPSYRLSTQTIDEMLMKSLNDPEWANICDLLVLWWEEGRRQKHKDKAVWTDRAFNMSLKVVYSIYTSSLTGKEAALDLVENAYQYGWQGIKREYSSFNTQKSTVQAVFQL